METKGGDTPDELLRLIAERTADVYWRTDVDGVLTHASAQVHRLIGRDPEEIVGTSLESLLHDDDLQEVSALQRTLFERSNTCTLAYRLKRSDGSAIWVEATSHALPSGFAGVWRDITERRRVEVAYEHQAYHDALTGLPNRRLFEDRLTIALAHSRRFGTRAALMCIDVDRFSRLNSTLGHPAGDEILRALAVRLLPSVRASDTFARLGADEFVLVVSNLRTEEDTVRVAQLLLDKLKAPIVVNGQELFITASIGIAIYPQDGREVSTLLASADAAAHTCKRLGGNGWHLHNSAINERALQRLAVEMDLHRAIDGSQFTVRYQPLLSVAQQEMTGVEALVRWQHPKQGEVMPDAFLGVAEETGLIIGIGQQVIAASCAQANAWIGQGWDNARISINLSARQFEDPALLTLIDHAVMRHGVPPVVLQFEITEGTALRDMKRSIHILNELRARGIQVAIDDFGIGYSSLAYLKQLPVSALKIDKTFLSGIPEARDAAIVASVIAMGHALGLTVIAEGVETMEQMEFLRQSGCDACQGFLFSKPTTAEEIMRRRKT